MKIVQRRTYFLEYIIVLILLCLTGCERVPTPSIDPPRPSNIPVSSIWVGGLDGGVFVSITKEKKLEKGMYFGAIYYVSGDFAYKGPMKIFPIESTNIDLSNKESFEGWDGETLYLSNNRQLKVQE